MSFDGALVRRVAAALAVDAEVVRRVISAVDNDSEYGPLARGTTQPRQVRCKLCKQMTAAEDVAEDKVCIQCRPANLEVDERAPSISVRAWRGGLPGLGKKA